MYNFTQNPWYQATVNNITNLPNNQQQWTITVLLFPGHTLCPTFVTHLSGSAHNHEHTSFGLLEHVDHQPVLYMLTVCT